MVESWLLNCSVRGISEDGKLLAVQGARGYPLLLAQLHITVFGFPGLLLVACIIVVAPSTFVRRYGGQEAELIQSKKTNF